MTSSSTDTKEIRRFGIVAFLFLGLLCGVALWRGKVVIPCVFGALSIVGLGLLCLPGPLSPVYRGWLKASRLIGLVVTTVVLTLMYYLVITPVGLLKRMASGPLLPLSPDDAVTTYWVRRTEAAQPRDRFYKRY